MSIETRHYVATIADIEALAREHALACVAQDRSQSTYLKVLVGTVQSELGLKHRERTVNSKPGEVNREQLSMVAKVHDRFYTVILRVVQEQWPRDAKERNRRSNYARSSYGTLRGWLNAGHDIGALAPGKVTKSALSVQKGGSSAPKQGALERRAARAIESLRESVQQLAKLDQGAAIEAAELVLAEVTQLLTEMGRTPVREDAARAASEHRPLVMRKANVTFWPVAAERAS